MTFRGTAAGLALQKKSKNTPPEDTGMEASYLKALGEKQTPVTVKLIGGESVRGWIEYYDANMIRLTREHSPNLFIYKHEIVYISEDNGRRGRL
jgi:host factor-I protein